MSFESCFKILTTLRDADLPQSAGVRQRFRRVVRSFYRSNGRDFPWRRTQDPYQILVSEVMLQQTQTQRVAERFPVFIHQFPNIRALAAARQSEVIRAWEGLGYYRRARNLHRAAQEVVSECNGEIPDSYDHLRALPGIGEYTAAAVSAFAFNRAVPMIETNIRAVYLYVFFKEQEGVSDRRILALIEETMPKSGVREWFYSLMDLGVELKRATPRINHASRHHTKQKPFHGSDRRVAAMVLRYVIGCKRPISKELIVQETLGALSETTLDQIERALVRLEREKLLVQTRSGSFRGA